MKTKCQSNLINLLGSRITGESDQASEPCKFFNGDKITVYTMCNVKLVWYRWLGQIRFMTELRKISIPTSSKVQELILLA